MPSKPSRHEKSSWNKQVEQAAQAIGKAKSLLNRLLKQKLSWEDQERGTNAKNYLDLASTAIWSMQYPTSEEIRRYERDEVP